MSVYRVNNYSVRNVVLQRNVSNVHIRMSLSTSLRKRKCILPLTNLYCWSHNAGFGAFVHFEGTTVVNWDMQFLDMNTGWRITMEMHWSNVPAYELWCGWVPGGFWPWVNVSCQLGGVNNTIIGNYFLNLLNYRLYSQLFNQTFCKISEEKECLQISILGVFRCPKIFSLLTYNWRPKRLINWWSKLLQMYFLSIN